MIGDLYTVALFTLNSLLLLGFSQEAEAFMAWLVARVQELIETFCKNTVCSVILVQSHCGRTGQKLPRNTATCKENTYATVHCAHTRPDYRPRRSGPC
ncbi:MAG: hypothetical protein ACJ8AG_23635, partial [Ktedonobacteraceae bacterium]